MDKSNLLAAPMIGRSKTADDPYTPYEEEEEEFHDKTQYITTMGALLYLSTYTRPDISFAVSVLARHSQRLLYTQGGTAEIIGYADAGFRSDETSGKSQTGYIFLKNMLTKAFPAYTHKRLVREAGMRLHHEFIPK
jgi:hypothetical protein